MSGVDGTLYTEVRTFYARQMRLLDALDVDGYVLTFTEDGVTDHAHRSERIEGRAALRAAARAALSRYENAAMRHWNDHYLIEPLAENRYAVSYCSLVSRTAEDGTVAFEPTFRIDDVLVRVDGELRTASRTIERDRPSSARLVDAS